MLDSSLIQSLKIQKRIIFSLLIREILTRYGRSNIGFLWLLAEPMLFTLIMMGVALFIRMREFSGMSVIAFALTGYSCLLFWRHIANRGKGAVNSNSGLLYHRNVKVLDIFLSRVILEAAGGTAAFIILVLILASFTSMGWPKDIIYMILAWALLGWFGTSLALCIGVLTVRSEMFGRIWSASSFPMFALSGTLFMIDWVPEPGRSYLLWVPMIHGTEMFRHGYFGNIIITHEDPLYLVTVNLCLTFTGLVMIKHLSAGAYLDD